MRDAIAEWQKACPFLKFKEINNIELVHQASFIKFDCIRFFHGDGSYSSLGRSGNGMMQSLSIDKDVNSKGTPMHEIGHALGMIHEHCRVDRDDDIIVYMDNIKKDKRHNYEKVSSNLLMTNGTSNSNYPLSSKIDFNSVMLYSSWSGFAIDQTKPVMVKKDLTDFYGQRDYISRNDKFIMHSFYGISPF